MVSLGARLEKAGFSVRYASANPNKLLRLIGMMTAVMSSGRKADVVLIDTYSTLNFWYAVIISKLCRFRGIPYIPILHGGNLPERLTRNRSQSASLFDGAYMNVAPSGYIKNAFEERNFKRVQYVPNAIDISLYQPAYRPSVPIRILWVRSLSDIYNPIMALNTVKNLHECGYKAHLCMVGPDKNGMRQQLTELTELNDLDVKFTGKLPKEEWIGLASDYNIFINTSNFDNMPVSVIEAMALGFPVVSTNVGGMPFLVDHGKTGYLVEPDDSVKMAEYIIELSSHPDRFREMAQQAREKAEQFDWSEVLPEWLRILNDISST